MGCWRAFLDRGISFGPISGSSIGALNGALVCQGDWRAAHGLWMELTETTIIRPDYERLKKLAAAAALDLGLLLLPVPKFRVLRVLKYAATALKFGSRHGALGVLREYGLLNIITFRPLLQKYLDLSRILRKSRQLFVTVSGTAAAAEPLGRAQWFALQQLSESEAWDVLAASMAVPFVFSPIEVLGQQYRDGGTSQWLPIRPLYDSGVRRMVVISLKASPGLNPADYPGSTLWLIKPEKSLGRFPGATFRFTRAAVDQWMEQGYTDASRKLDREPIFQT
jgi:NTE family protein